MEIWPRVFTLEVNKSDPKTRRALVTERYPDLGRKLIKTASSSDDAFDALVSALEMDRHLGEFPDLPAASSAEMALEGRIWRPFI